MISEECQVKMTQDVVSDVADVINNLLRYAVHQLHVYLVSSVNYLASDINNTLHF